MESQRKAEEAARRGNSKSVRGNELMLNLKKEGVEGGKVKREGMEDHDPVYIFNAKAAWHGPLVLNLLWAVVLKKAHAYSTSFLLTKHS